VIAGEAVTLKGSFIMWQICLSKQVMVNIQRTKESTQINLQWSN